MLKCRRGAARWAALISTVLLSACSDETGGSDLQQAPQPVAGGAAPAAALPSLAPDNTAASPSSQGVTTRAAAPSSGTASPDGPAVAPAANSMPCEVSHALASACHKCHGASPTFGAPMPLVTHEDFQKPSPSDASTPVFKMALARMNDMARPMPPASAISQTDRQTLSDWLSGGALATNAQTVECAPVVGTTNASDPSGAPVVRDEQYFKNGITPDPGETCYELVTHGGQLENDDSKFDVQTGEFYEQFYFRVPWTQDEVMTRFGAKYDNLKVLHHWLLFTSSMGEQKIGTHETVSGSTLGDTSELIAGWAVGGDHVEFPKDTGLELTPTGILNMQWHYYNAGSQVEPDATRVQICTVPKTMRQNIGSLTFLGTENFNGPFGMPAKTRSDFSGTCVNDSGGPITIFGFTPHMHKFGINMMAVVIRNNGMMEEVFNKPFDFNSQITHILPTPLTLEAGEQIISTCTFDNTSDFSVPFGPSSDQEMCYNFTMSYPAQALNNGVPSLIGATNTCW